MRSIGKEVNMRNTTRQATRRRFMLAAKRHDTATLVLVWERNLPCVD